MDARYGLPLALLKKNSGLLKTELANNMRTNICMEKKIQQIVTE